MKKKGLSVVIATVLMILLVLASVTIVWGVVKGIINKQTEKSKDCYEVEFGGKVTINEDYTCWNSTNSSVYVSISILDAEIDGLLISIESAGTSKSFELINTVQDLTEVKNYPSYSQGVKLPSQNGGLTYYVTGFTSLPGSIKISPRVGDNQCQQTDIVTQIEDCNIFVGL